MPTLKIDNRSVEADLILFDLDGTLVDDRDRYRSLASIRLRLMLEMAGNEAALTWARLSGVNPETLEVDPKGPLSKAQRREDQAIAAAALYLHGHPYNKARELAQRIYNEADKSQADSYTPHLFNGASNALRRLIDKGFRLGITTNGETRITVQVLEALEISGLFDVVVGADMVGEVKPAPDLILKACEMLGMKPSQAIYMGDQPTDAQAGRAAGVAMVVGIGDVELMASGADVVFQSVAELA